MINMRGITRMDAAESAFFARELEIIQTKTYDIRYPELKHRQFCPTTGESNGGADTTTYRQYDEVGRAKFISDNADDLPNVDVKGEEFTRPYRMMGVSYGWNYKELKRSQMTGRSLDGRRANTARNVIEELLDYTACFGSPIHGIVDGFLNNAAIPSQAAAAAWNGLAADLIIKDVADGVSRIHDLTKGIWMPDTVLLPLTPYVFIATKPRSTTSDTTILDFILKSFPMIKKIEPWYRLATAGAGSASRMVIYKRDPDVLSHEIGQEFLQLAPQERGLRTIVPCIAETAGVQIPQPKAIDFTDGI